MFLGSGSSDPQNSTVSRKNCNRKSSGRTVSALEILVNGKESRGQLGAHL